MKYSVAILAAAAALGQVSATFGGKGFYDAAPYTCPKNTDNKCIPKQSGGIHYGGLNPGSPIDKHDGFKYSGGKGWTCGGSKKGRDLMGRTYGGEQYASADCDQGAPEDDSPAIGCIEPQDNPENEPTPDKFSIKKFDIDIPFNCRMEFHYDMPDGSKCKTSHNCNKGRNQIENNQCGGAKKVKFVYPEQGKKEKKCNVKVHHIDFDCEDHKPPHEKPPHEKPPHEKPPHTKPPHEKPTTTYGPPPPVDTPPAANTTYVPPEHSTTPVPEDTTTEEVPPETPTTYPEDTTTDVPPETPTVTYPGETDTTEYPETETTEAPETETTESPETETTEAPETTVYQTTSTIYTTSVSTITSCGPEVPDCPANGGSTVLTTVTKVVGTTVCPVTEVVTTGKAEPTGPAPPEETSPAEPEGPDCPEVVPRCLKTWIPELSECKDNLDAKCYCKAADVINKVYECIYAYGGDDDLISEAIQALQGICAEDIPENPAIVTGADSVTTCITVTGTPLVTSAEYTTVYVDATLTVPCVSEGSTIPGSSTVTTITSEVTVPKVTLPPAPPAESEGAPVPPPTTPAPPVGTGGLTPAPTQPGDVPVTAGAANVRVGMGLGLAVMALVAAL